MARYVIYLPLIHYNCSLVKHQEEKNSGWIPENECAMSGYHQQLNI
jgi:hypothetical protein